MTGPVQSLSLSYTRASVASSATSCTAMNPTAMCSFSRSNVSVLSVRSNKLAEFPGAEVPHL
jgi:hypothetical protein